MSGYGLAALWGYCTCGQILNKGQPAPGQVTRPGGYLHVNKNLGGTRTAGASGPQPRERHFDFRA